MPTLRRSEVEQTVEQMLQALRDLGPGHHALASVKAQMGGSGHHFDQLARAAVDVLAGQGKLEVWLKYARSGRHRVLWVRQIQHVRLLRGEPRRRPRPPAVEPAAAAEPAQEPVPAPRWEPKRKYKYPKSLHTNPDLLALVEANLLALLAGKHDPRDLAIAALFVSPPGPGWIPHAFISTRATHGVPHPEYRRSSLVGDARRSLERKGLIECIGTRMRHGRKRCRWLRLVRRQPAVVGCSSWPEFWHPEASRA